MQLHGQYLLLDKRNVGSIIIVIVMLLTITLRMHNIGVIDLWVDDANSVLIAERPLHEIIKGIQFDSSPPLYYFTLHYWIKLFGHDIIPVRILSVLFGFALVGTTFLVGLRLFSLEVGIVASILMCVSPVQVYYSQQVRMYTLLPLLSILSLYFLLKTISEYKKHYIIGYFITTLLCLYAHNYSFHLLPSHLLIIVCSKPDKRHLIIFLGCGIAITLCYLPWLPNFLIQLNNTTQYSWFVPYWEKFGFVGTILRTLKSYTPGLGITFSRLDGLKHFQFLPVILILMPIAWFALDKLFYKRTDSFPRNRDLMIAIYTIVPILSGIVASFLFTPHYVPGRCDQIVYPGFLILLAIGITRISPVFLRYCIFGSLIGYSFIGLWYNYNKPPAKAERSIAQAIVQHAKPGDAVIFTYLSRAAVEYYLNMEKVPLKLYSYPRDTAQHLGNQDNNRLLEKPNMLSKEAEYLVKQIRNECGYEARFFLVLTPQKVNEPLTDYFLDKRLTQKLKNIGIFSLQSLGIHAVLTLHQFKVSDDI